MQRKQKATNIAVEQVEKLANINRNTVTKRLHDAGLFDRVRVKKIKLTRKIK